MSSETPSAGRVASGRVERARSFRPGRLAAQVLVTLIAVGLWWLASALLPRDAMPSPATTVVELVELATTLTFWNAVGVTIAGFAAGLVASIVLGVPIGLAIGASSLATQSTRLVVDFLRTIPPIAILPLFLLVIGANFEMVFALVVAGAVWPILIQSIYAARQGEVLLAEMSRSFRIPRGWYVRHIFLPGALPFILTGIRVGTTICLLLTITGQLLGGAPGVGFEIADAMGYYDNPRMYAYVLVSAILGLLVNGGFFLLQRRLLRWHPSVRREGLQ